MPTYFTSISLSSFLSHAPPPTTPLHRPPRTPHSLNPPQLHLPPHLSLSPSSSSAAQEPLNLHRTRMTLLPFIKLAYGCCGAAGRGEREVRQGDVGGEGEGTSFQAPGERTSGPLWSVGSSRCPCCLLTCRFLLKRLSWTVKKKKKKRKKKEQKKWKNTGG